MQLSNAFSVLLLLASADDAISTATVASKACGAHGGGEAVVAKRWRRNSGGSVNGVGFGIGGADDLSCMVGMSGASGGSVASRGTRHLAAPPPGTSAWSQDP